MLENNKNETVMTLFKLFCTRSRHITISDVMVGVNFLTSLVKIRIIFNVTALDHKIAADRRKDFSSPLYFL